MTKTELQIVRFCSEEVERQQDSPRMVYHMVFAWMEVLEWFEEAKKDYGDDAKYSLTPAQVEKLGALVHPAMNPTGFRRVNVQVGDHIAPDWIGVPRLINRLFLPDVLKRMTPQEVYLEFEHVHPFRDGNGRAGKLIFFWMLGKLDEPNHEDIPNPFNIGNP